MAIKTELFVPHLPGKEMTADTDWLGILNSFDPTTLEKRFLDECARRNPYETCFGWDTPARPVKERLFHSKLSFEHDRGDLEGCVGRITKEGLTPLTYRLARAALIKAIGSKGAHEYNRQEYERLGEDGRKAQADEYRIWEQNWQRQRELDEQEFASGYFFNEASVHEKVVRIRKGLKASNGKPLTQRDFAKLIGYPINKYTDAERVDHYGLDYEESPVETELLDKLVMIAHANPYWLFDSDCEAFMAHDNPNDDAVLMGDEPSTYAPIDIILRWIREGKPRITRWSDGIWTK